MPQPQLFESGDPALMARFDDVIDVRSPGEFAEDHVPGALNLPVLSDEERAAVGTIYVQDSAFRARRIGAALVARNVARHLEMVLADRPPDYKPLVYCWRGGQRSNAMATILGQIGWRPFVLDGGYRTYRRWVQKRLYGDAPPIDLVLLDGGTGTGKTDVLQALTGFGVQTIDLEALAEHRGSLFGGRIGEAQPRQKMFESRLLAKLEAFDPGRPVVAEAESRKIGDCMIPPALWSAMAGAPRIILTAARMDRARYLVSRYPHIAANPEALKQTIGRLPIHIGRKDLDAFYSLLAAGDFIALAEALMTAHYDPAYARSALPQDPIGQIKLEDLNTASIETAAKKVLALLQRPVGAAPA